MHGANSGNWKSDKEPTCVWRIKRRSSDLHMLLNQSMSMRNGLGLPMIEVVRTMSPL